MGVFSSRASSATYGTSSSSSSSSLSSSLFRKSPRCDRYIGFGVDNPFVISCPNQSFEKCLGREDRSELKNILLSKDLDPNCKDFTGNTLLHTIILRSNVIAMELLLQFDKERKIKWKKHEHKGLETEEKTEEKKLQIKDQEIDEQTTKNNNLSADSKANSAVLTQNPQVPFLDYNILNDNGQSPLLLLIDCMGKKSHSSVTSSDSASIAAAQQINWIQIANLLLCSGADPNYVSVNDRLNPSAYPLAAAFLSKNSAIFHLLLQFGAKIETFHFRDFAHFLLPGINLSNGYSENKFKNTKHNENDDEFKIQLKLLGQIVYKRKKENQKVQGQSSKIFLNPATLSMLQTLLRFGLVVDRKRRKGIIMSALINGKNMEEAWKQAENEVYGTDGLFSVRRDNGDGKNIFYRIQWKNLIEHNEIAVRDDSPPKQSSGSDVLTVTAPQVATPLTNTSASRSISSTASSSVSISAAAALPLSPTSTSTMSSFSPARWFWTSKSLTPSSSSSSSSSACIPSGPNVSVRDIYFSCLTSVKNNYSMKVRDVPYGSLSSVYVPGLCSQCVSDRLPNNLHICVAIGLLRRLEERYEFWYLIQKYTNFTDDIMWTLDEHIFQYSTSELKTEINEMKNITLKDKSEADENLLVHSGELLCTHHRTSA